MGQRNGNAQHDPAEPFGGSNPGDRIRRDTPPPVRVEHMG